MTGARSETSRCEPASGLRGLVTPYHGYHYTGLEPGVHHGLPSTELTVVIAFEEPLDVAWMSDDASRGRHWAMASGLHTAPALIRHTGLQHGIQFGLTPWGARVLLGLPAREIAATMLSLDALVGPLVNQLYDEVAGAPTWPKRFDVLNRHLLAHAGRSDHTTPIRGELRWVWRELARTRGTVRVGELADAVGWSRRHLSARFGDEFGLGLKQAARVLRFQHSRSYWSPGGGMSLAEVAAACGYSDQAHLTREWRELAGYTPMQWLREEFPFLQDSVAAR